ncbi:ribosomal protein L7/L12 [Nocardioides phosphati]|nr:ribosomal protein L7/L12 [Nocardioides phosphati]
MRFVSPDHHWLSWSTPLDFVIGCIGWGLLLAGVSLISGGLRRFPLPGRPHGLHPEMLAKREAEWARANADLLEEGQHEVVVTDLGEDWMEVVKAIRRVTRLDVTAAMGLVKPLGQAVVQSRSEAAAESIATRLRAAGASAVVQPEAPKWREGSSSPGDEEPSR